MRIGYFTNQYPAVSHTFIRREILALESLGVDVVRYAVKPREDGLVDPTDQEELARTQHILRAGAAVMVGCALKALVLQPGAALVALRLTITIGLRSERGLLRNLAYLIEAIVLARWCRRDGIQHLHVHFGTNSTAIAMLASRFSGIPYSFTVHGPDDFEKGMFLSFDEKIRHAAFAVCVSAFGRSQLMRFVPESYWERIKLVHCGLDSQFLTDAVPPPVDTARLVCVGRLCAEKAQILLVDAVKILNARGIRCEVVLVGDGPMRPAIEAAIDRAGLRDQISITGWVSSERVREEMAHARAFVLPSFAENLPVVIMEALALARPVVSTYIAGIPELVRPGENGWLVPASDVAALADALGEACAAPLERIVAMGEAGRRRVREAHDATREAEKLKVYFAEAICKVKA